MAHVGVLLSGCGVFDGSEIQESVFVLYHLARHGFLVSYYAPDVNQMHVLNHITGAEQHETRNVMVESARITRGTISPVSEFDADRMDALVLPGGFGTAKNHTNWAVSGDGGTIRPDVQNAVVHMVKRSKPVVALCMAPTTVAKALEGSGIKARLTVGTPQEPSPYDIAGISDGITHLGCVAEYKGITEISIDTENKIICAPCYMMEAGITGIISNVEQAINALAEVLGENPG